MNKIIIILGVILIAFAGFLFYQFNKTPAKTMSGTTQTVMINNGSFKVEVVTDQKEQEIGLIKYTALKPDQGMLFVFPQKGYHPFWMRGMHFPIDLIFIDGVKVSAAFENLPPVDSKTPEDKITTYGGFINSEKAVELSAGMIKKYNIKKGDLVTIK